MAEIGREHGKLAFDVRPSLVEPFESPNRESVAKVMEAWRVLHLGFSQTYSANQFAEYFLDVRQAESCAVF